MGTDCHPFQWPPQSSHGSGVGFLHPSNGGCRAEALAPEAWMALTGQGCLMGWRLPMPSDTGQGSQGDLKQGEAG